MPLSILINPKNIIVIVDDIDIPFGTVKIKRKVVQELITD